MSKPPLWKVELRPPVDEQDPEGVHRVRRALKCLLRSFGLTATSVVKVESVPVDRSEASEGGNE
jgi:hypothetical protein